MAKCPSCGGALRFEAEDAEVRCTHCGTVAASVPEPVVRGVADLDLDALLVEMVEMPLGERTLACRSCGARTAHPATQKVVDCPFCGSTTVEDAPGLPIAFRPLGVLPFRLTPEQAAEALGAWARGLWFRPSGLARAEGIQGVYVPFWTLDAHCMASTDGVVHVRDKNGTPSRAPYSGLRKVQYDDVLVCASHGLRPELVEGIEPFPTVTELVPYDPRFLTGWSAEEPQLTPAEAWTRGEEGIRRNEYRHAVADATEVHPGEAELTLDLRLSARRARPILLPVYVATCRGQQVLVNGVTGAVCGRAAFSPWKIALLVLALLPLLVLLTVATAGTDLVFFAGLALVLKVLVRRRAGQREREALNSARVTVS